MLVLVLDRCCIPFAAFRNGLIPTDCTLPMVVGRADFDNERAESSWSALAFQPVLYSVCRRERELPARKEGGNDAINFTQGLCAFGSSDCGGRGGGRNGGARPSALHHPPPPAPPAHV